MKHQQRPEDQLLPFSIIESATQGDPDAISSVLNHFYGYIATLSTRTLYDEYGRSYRCLDPELKKRMEAKLIVRILQKFKPE